MLPATKARLAKDTFFDSTEILPCMLTYVVLKVFQREDSHLPASVSRKSYADLGAATISRHVDCVTRNQCAPKALNVVAFSVGNLFRLIGMRYEVCPSLRL